MISNKEEHGLIFYLIIIIIFGMTLAFYNNFKQRNKQKEVKSLFQNWQYQLENSQDKIFYYRQSQYEFESKNPDLADQDFWDALDLLRERACIFKGQDYWLSLQYQ